MANLRNVKVVLYEPDRDLRSVLRGKLRELEFEDILDTPTVDSVEQAFLDGEVDLAILGTIRENDVMCRLLRDIRQGERGDNPFPVAIATCDAASEKHMRSVIDAGFDNALIKPFDAASIARRVRHFCQSRNPFVVTHDYIGPDRRSEKRRIGADPKLIDAPNPVRILADGHTAGIFSAGRSVRPGASSMKRNFKRTPPASNGLSTDFAPVRSSATPTRLSNAASLLHRSIGRPKTCSTGRPGPSTRMWPTCV